MKPITNEQLQEVMRNYGLADICTACKSYGEGHINDTFLVTTTQEGIEKVILQRVNHEVFTKPQQLMENVAGVTTFLHNKIKQEGGDPQRETLNMMKTVDGTSYYKDSTGDYWRVYQFITDAVCYEQVKAPEDFYESAVAFGHFQRMLSDYPVETLHESIKGFHDTRARFGVFLDAVQKDVKGRVDSCKEEIEFYKAHEFLCDCFAEELAQGNISLRVTHNDTKLNNIMMDKKTGKGICVLDLDTVMPGFVMNDFGDSIRFGANTALEDEKDLSKVSCDLHLFEMYTKGFLEGCEGSLNEREMELLPMGAKVMTFECGMRFLTDYLLGDVYFKTARPEHNLDRARTQMCMVADMERKWEQMQEIIAQYKNL